MTVAVATSCTGIFTETFLGLSSAVSVEFRVQEVTTATITQHSRNTQCSNGTEICSSSVSAYGSSVLCAWARSLYMPLT